MVYAGCGATIDVERYAEVFEGFLDEVVVAVNHLLRGDALLARAYSDGYAMLVATADENNVLLLEAKIANIDIGWHVNTCQVADMHTTVSVRQCCGYGGTFEILLFHIS